MPTAVIGAIPAKRHLQRPIAFLDRDEIDALLAAPDGQSWIGRRDRTLLLVAIQTGLRVSELTHLRRADVTLGTGAHLRCEGKGRKQRCTPLRREAAAMIAAWLRECRAPPEDPVFPAKLIEQASRQNGVAVLAAFALLHPNRHPTREIGTCAVTLVR